VLELWKGVELLSLLVNVPTNLATWPPPPVNFLAARAGQPRSLPQPGFCRLLRSTESYQKFFLGSCFFGFCLFVMYLPPHAEGRVMDRPSTHSSPGCM
jgi:hypothetical protein